MQDKSVMGQKILLLLVVECEIKKNVNASFLLSEERQINVESPDLNPSVMCTSKSKN
jgi:hypothetical protein